VSTTPPPDASLDDLLAAARTRYRVRFDSVTVGGTTLEVPQIEDMEAFVDGLLRDLPEGMPPELPFWAKIWRTSLLASLVVQRLEAEGRSLLEIGSGVGVCGLFAAARGFTATISDICPDAVLFIRIAALKNGLGDRVRARRVDFTKDRLGERFDVIVGSEILYLEKQARPLVKFLDAHISLRPGAEIVLARNYCRQAKKFLSLAQDAYDIKACTIGFKSSAHDSADKTDDSGPTPEKHLSTIYRMTRKTHA